MSGDGDTAPPEPLIGWQSPTQELRCNGGDTYEGDRAIGIARVAGLELDPWQQRLLRESLGVDPVTGLWSAFEVCWIVSRQNGKSTALFARALLGLFLLGEREISWTAHRYDTAMDAFNKMVKLIKGTPELRSELAQTRNEGISTTHGNESITLRSGQRISFKTRTDESGRGLGGDLVIIDEVQDAKLAQMAATLPTLGAKPNPQVIYAGSAGGPRSYVLGNLVHRATATEPGDPVRDRLYFAQWAADEDDDPAAPETWAKANPSLNLRLDVETMAGFYRQWRYELAYFGMEHLGQGNYPRPEGEDWIIPSADWLRREDRDSTPVTDLVLAVDGTPDQQWATISLAGFRSDGIIHFGVIAHERGTRWTVHRLAELAHELELDTPILLDPKSPVAYLLADYEQIGLDVKTLTPTEWADMTSWLISAGTERSDADDWQPQFFHPGQPLMTSALAAATVRNRGDRVVLSRQSGDVPSSPLTASALAGYGLVLLGRIAKPPPSPEIVPASTQGTWDRPNFAGMSF